MSDVVRWLRACQEVEQRNVRTVSGASEAAELYGRAADEITRLRARVAELEARVRPVNGYGIALMMIAEGVNDPRHFAKDTLAKWRPIINAGIST